MQEQHPQHLSRVVMLQGNCAQISPCLARRVLHMQQSKPNPQNVPDVYIVKDVTPTSVQNVNDIFMFTVMVGVNTLEAAFDVNMEDIVPDQLTILNITEVPNENGEIIIAGYVMGSKCSSLLRHSLQGG
jgi:hypothetical protein